MINEIKTQLEDFKNKSPAEQLIILLPYIAIIVPLVRIAELYRLCEGDLLMIINNLEYLYKGPPHIALTDLLIGIPAGFFLVRYWKASIEVNRKNIRQKDAYGSARWGTPEDIKPFIDPDPFYNILLSRTERLTMNPKMKIFKYNRNKHVMVYGGSGSGKTFGIVKPNLYQLHSSYVLTDPKGTLLPETGNLFAKKGYRIKVLDTIDFANSMHYNPFAYLKRPKDILTLATTLFMNLKPSEGSGGEFFDTAALLWLQTIIGYLWYEAPPEEQNINTLLELLEADDVREDDENYKNAVDMLFEELEEINPRHFAVKQRKKYKKAAGDICSK